MNTITVKVEKTEKERLNKIALRQGLSLSELAKKILMQAQDQFALESLEDYDNPEELKKDIETAMLEYKQGKFLTKLWK